MKKLLIILLLLCSVAAFGQNRLSADFAHADSALNKASSEAPRIALLRTAVERAAAETTAHFADKIKELTDCSNMVEIAEKICDRPRTVYVAKRYMAKRGYPVRIVIIAHYDPQTNASHYQFKRIKYTKRQYQ